MKSKFLVVVMLAALFGAAPVWAGWHGGRVGADRSSVTPDMKTAKPKKWDVTLEIKFSSSYTSGPCTGGSGNADYCPTGDCQCYTATGTVKGTAGTGSVTLYETFDLGGEFVETDSGCAPAYGDIEIAGSKDDESVALTGADCGSSLDQGFLQGGCQLTDSSHVFSHVGLGTCGGNYSDTSNQTFTIKGEGE